MRTQNPMDRRRYFKMQGKGFFSNAWSDGAHIISGGLKNLGSKLLPIAQEYAKDMGKKALNKFAEEAPKYIENKTRDFITEMGSSSNKLETAKNFGKNSGKELGNSFRNEIKSAINSQGTQDVINQIRGETKNELSNSASNILNSLLSGRGLQRQQIQKQTKRGAKRKNMMGNGMIPIF